MNTPSSASSPPAWRIEPQGDRCLLVRFGDSIDVETGRLCLAAARVLRQAPLPGVTDVVPSFVTVAVHYRPAGSQGPRYPQLAAQVEQLLARGVAADAQAARRVEIPVCYGGEYGPDLDDVARHAGISPEDVVKLHTGADSLVFMLGFAPGAPYLGVHDPRLDIPRRASPRTAVPAGSVAVANRQSVLYPSQSPGGWNIIGATPAVLFDPAGDPPTLLQPGDSVRFVPIGPDEFKRLREAAQ